MVNQAGYHVTFVFYQKVKMSALRLVCTFGLCLITAYSASAECNNNGYKNAEGICQCSQGFYGKACECSSEYGLPLEACMSDYGRNSTIVCSNRGECACGICDCHSKPGTAQRYTGMFCQCDDYSCGYANGLLCNGHGTCQCGDCQCDELYTGAACENTLSTDQCVSPYSGKICNGAGECINGACRCKQGYMGPQCDDCMTCPSPCERLKPCVFCMINDTTSPYCSEVCKSTTTVIVDELGAEDKMCKFRRDDDVNVQFTYKYVVYGYLIHIPKMPQNAQYESPNDDSTNSPSSASFSGGFSYFLELFILISTVVLLQTF